MTEFTSEVKKVASADDIVYNTLSNLSNLELIKDKLPDDKIKDLSFDQDSCSITVNPIGKIRFVVIEKQANSLIKFKAEQIPFNLILNIELNQISANDTDLQLKVEADLNPFIKSFVSGPLQEGLEKIATTLASIPYNELNK